MIISTYKNTSQILPDEFRNSFFIKTTNGNMPSQKRLCGASNPTEALRRCLSMTSSTPAKNPWSRVTVAERPMPKMVANAQITPLRSHLLAHEESYNSISRFLYVVRKWFVSRNHWISFSFYILLLLPSHSGPNVFGSNTDLPRHLSI